MAQYPPSIRAAQVVGLTGAAWLAGNIGGYSFITIPSLLKSHTEHSASLPLIVKQWRDMYEAGKAQNPPIAILTATAFGYLAWSVHKSIAIGALAPKNAVALYSAAAALTVGIVPWTLAVMVPTNKKLIGRAESVWVEDEGSVTEVKGLIGKWTVLNTLRGVFPLLGAVVGVLAF
ncbi:hypothetical protein BJY04DRAFT_134518 [Aspergillus karnatakaensis]|uniref:DUF1772 domain-containing protein n=1 Tax=Aspergillus karnatakaensis TaxID=1810916 RepID=UPI003CCCA6B5